MPPIEDRDLQRVVTDNLGLVHDIARSLHQSGGTGPERGDLVSAGVRGLIQAASSFDPSRGLAFSTFAVPRVRGAMLDEMRRWDQTPRSVRSKERELKATEAELQARLARRPTPGEMAAEIELAPEELHAWVRDVARYASESLDEAPPHGYHEATHTGHDLVADDREDVVERLGREQAIEKLAGCLQELPEREAKILALYYFEGLRLREIAQILGVTESRISQIRHAALRTLRSMLSQVGVDPHE